MTALARLAQLVELWGLPLPPEIAHGDARPSVEEFAAHVLAKPFDLPPVTASYLCALNLAVNLELLAEVERLKLALHHLTPGTADIIAQAGRAPAGGNAQENLLPAAARGSGQRGEFCAGGREKGAGPERVSDGPASPGPARFLESLVTTEACS